MEIKLQLTYPQFEILCLYLQSIDLYFNRFVTEDKKLIYSMCYRPYNLLMGHYHRLAFKNQHPKHINRTLAYHEAYGLVQLLADFINTNENEYHSVILRSIHDQLHQKLT